MVFFAEDDFQLGAGNNINIRGDTLLFQPSDSSSTRVTLESVHGVEVTGKNGVDLDAGDTLRLRALEDTTVRAFDILLLQMADEVYISTDGTASDVNIESYAGDVTVAGNALSIGGTGTSGLVDFQSQGDISFLASVDMVLTGENIRFGQEDGTTRNVLVESRQETTLSAGNELFVTAQDEVLLRQQTVSFASADRLSIDAHEGDYLAQTSLEFTADGALNMQTRERGDILLQAASELSMRADSGSLLVSAFDFDARLAGTFTSLSPSVDVTSDAGHSVTFQSGESFTLDISRDLDVTGKNVHFLADNTITLDSTSTSVTAATFTAATHADNIRLTSTSGTTSFTGASAMLRAEAGAKALTFDAADSAFFSSDGNTLLWAEEAINAKAGNGLSVSATDTVRITLDKLLDFNVGGQFDLSSNSGVAKFLTGTLDIDSGEVRFQVDGEESQIDAIAAWIDVDAASDTAFTTSLGTITFSGSSAVMMDAGSQWDLTWSDTLLVDSDQDARFLAGEDIVFTLTDELVIRSEDSADALAAGDLRLSQGIMTMTAHGDLTFWAQQETRFSSNPGTAMLVESEFGDVVVNGAGDVLIDSQNARVVGEAGRDILLTAKVLDVSAGGTGFSSTSSVDASFNASQDVNLKAGNTVFTDSVNNADGVTMEAARNFDADVSVGTSTLLSVGALIESGVDQGIWVEASDSTLTLSASDALAIVGAADATFSAEDGNAEFRAGGAHLLAAATALVMESEADLQVLGRNGVDDTIEVSSGGSASFLTLGGDILIDNVLKSTTITAVDDVSITAHGGSEDCGVSMDATVSHDWSADRHMRLHGESCIDMDAPEGTLDWEAAQSVFLEARTEGVIITSNSMTENLSLHARTFDAAGNIEIDAKDAQVQILAANDIQLISSTGLNSLMGGDGVQVLADDGDFVVTTFSGVDARGARGLQLIAGQDSPNQPANLIVNTVEGFQLLANDAILIDSFSDLSVGLTDAVQFNGNNLGTIQTFNGNDIFATAAGSISMTGETFVEVSAAGGDVTIDANVGAFSAYTAAGTFTVQANQGDVSFRSAGSNSAVTVTSDGEVAFSAEGRDASVSMSANNDATIQAGSSIVMEVKNGCQVIQTEGLVHDIDVDSDSLQMLFDHGTVLGNNIDVVSQTTTINTDRLVIGATTSPLVRINTSPEAGNPATPDFSLTSAGDINWSSDNSQLYNVEGGVTMAADGDINTTSAGVVKLIAGGGDGVGVVLDADNVFLHGQALKALGPEGVSIEAANDINLSSTGDGRADGIFLTTPDNTIDIDNTITRWNADQWQVEASDATFVSTAALEILGDERILFDSDTTIDITSDFAGVVVETTGQEARLLFDVDSQMGFTALSDSSIFAVSSDNIEVRSRNAIFQSTGDMSVTSGFLDALAVPQAGAVTIVSGSTGPGGIEMSSALGDIFWDSDGANGINIQSRGSAGISITAPTDNVLTAGGDLTLHSAEDILFDGADSAGDFGIAASSITGFFVDTRGTADFFATSGDFTIGRYVPALAPTAFSACAADAGPSALTNSFQIVIPVAQVGLITDLNVRFSLDLADTSLTLGDLTVTLSPEALTPQVEVLTPFDCAIAGDNSQVLVDVTFDQQAVLLYPDYIDDSCQIAGDTITGGSYEPFRNGLIPPPENTLDSFNALGVTGNWILTFSHPALILPTVSEVCLDFTIVPAESEPTTFVGESLDFEFQDMFVTSDSDIVLSADDRYSGATVNAEFMTIAAPTSINAVASGSVNIDAVGDISFAAVDDIVVQTEASDITLTSLSTSDWTSPIISYSASSFDHLTDAGFLLRTATDTVFTTPANVDVSFQEAFDFVTGEQLDVVLGGSLAVEAGGWNQDVNFVGPDVILTSGANTDISGNVVAFDSARSLRFLSTTGDISVTTQGGIFFGLGASRDTERTAEIEGFIDATADFVTIQTDEDTSDVHIDLVARGGRTEEFGSPFQNIFAANTGDMTFSYPAGISFVNKADDFFLDAATIQTPLTPAATWDFTGDISIAAPAINLLNGVDAMFRSGKDIIADDYNTVTGVDVEVRAVGAGPGHDIGIRQTTSAINLAGNLEFGNHASEGTLLFGEDSDALMTVEAGLHFLMTAQGGILLAGSAEDVSYTSATGNIAILADGDLSDVTFDSQDMILHDIVGALHLQTNYQGQLGFFSVVPEIIQAINPNRVNPCATSQFSNLACGATLQGHASAADISNAINEWDHHLNEFQLAMINYGFFDYKTSWAADVAPP